MKERQWKLIIDNILSNNNRNQCNITTKNTSKTKIKENKRKTSKKYAKYKKRCLRLNHEKLNFASFFVTTSVFLLSYL